MLPRFLFALLLVIPLAAAAQPPRPGADKLQSQTQWQRGAIATAHPQATAAGFEILRAGGNAFDAAVAVSATLAVVEPYSSGLGGGGFWLLHRAADGRQVMLDGRETAPLAASRDMYLDAAGEVIPRASVDGALAAGIPGEPAALVRLAREFGRLPLSRTLAPAIRAAREGFVVTPHYRRMAEFRLGALRASPAAAQVFLHNGAVPPLGHRIVQPDLARTLEALAQRGRDGFYAGQIAGQMLAGVQAAGGIWQARDLAGYKVKSRQPLAGHYHGMRIVSAPPPSSGGVALLTMLNILAGYPLRRLDPVTQTHLVVEAMRRAYRDRAVYLGDPDFVPVPVRRLTGKAWADRLRAGIDPQRATPSAALAPPSGGNHTTHFSILDAAGNRVAATLSINYPFGSGYMPPGTGVLLNDEMDDFSAKPGVPNVYGLVGGEANAIAPGKRMLSSMSPTFVEDRGRLLILGTPGGSRIISMVLLGILGYAGQQPPAVIVSRPRYHHQYLPDILFHEPDAFDASMVQALQARGHHLQKLAQRWGNMQLVFQDRKHRLTAASDPRGEGAARVE